MKRGATPYRTGLIPFQLANDRDAYGENAGKWIIRDGEQEIEKTVYGTEEACRLAIENHQLRDMILHVIETAEREEAERRARIRPDPVAELIDREQSRLQGDLFDRDGHDRGGHGRDF